MADRKRSNFLEDIDPKYFGVLRKLNSRLTGINWAVTESLNFALHGMSVEPNDIDIQTDKEGAYAIEEEFEDHVVDEVRFSSSDVIRSHYGKLEINGIEVEIMGDIQKKVEGDWESPVDIEEYKETVEIEGMEIPVLSLNYEYQAYLKLGRTDRAMKIKRWLKENG